MGSGSVTELEPWESPGEVYERIMEQSMKERARRWEESPEEMEVIASEGRAARELFREVWAQYLLGHPEEREKWVGELKEKLAELGQKRERAMLKCSICGVETDKRYPTGWYVPEYLLESRRPLGDKVLCVNCSG